jgi:hypothetical protein
MWLWGDEVDAHVPPLQSRTAGKLKPKPVAPPVPPPA